MIDVQGEMYEKKRNMSVDFWTRVQRSKIVRVCIANLCGKSQI